MRCLAHCHGDCGQADVADGGQEVRLHREQHDEQDAEVEVGRRDGHARPGGGGAVRDRAGTRAGEDADGQPEHDREDEPAEGERQCERQALPDAGGHALVLEQRRAEVAADDVGEPPPVLGEERLVQVELVADGARSPPDRP